MGGGDLSVHISFVSVNLPPKCLPLMLVGKLASTPPKKMPSLRPSTEEWAHTGGKGHRGTGEWLTLNKEMIITQVDRQTIPGRNSDQLSAKIYVNEGVLFIMFYMMEVVNMRFQNKGWGVGGRGARRNLTNLSYISLGSVGFYSMNCLVLVHKNGGTIKGGNLAFSPTNHKG